MSVETCNMRIMRNYLEDWYWMLKENKAATVEEEIREFLSIPEEQDERIRTKYRA